jgi:hypothetical protein
MITLPKRIWFTGAPGSQWSGIAEELEKVPGINTSDHAPGRRYEFKNSIHNFLNHGGAYFGSGMEFAPKIDATYVDAVWKEPGGTRIVKSHEWAYNLNEIKTRFPNDWIMMIYRPDTHAYAWWHESGGFGITYPNYSWYRNHAKMLGEIASQNDQMLKFAYDNDLQWSSCNTRWIKENFGYEVDIEKRKNWRGILVTILKQGNSNENT